MARGPWRDLKARITIDLMRGINAYPGIDNQESYPVGVIALRDTCFCEIAFDDLEAACRIVPGLRNRILHLMSYRIIDDQ